MPTTTTPCQQTTASYSSLKENTSNPAFKLPQKFEWGRPLYDLVDEVMKLNKNLVLKKGEGRKRDVRPGTSHQALLGILPFCTSQAPVGGSNDQGLQCQDNNYPNCMKTKRTMISLSIARRDQSPPDLTTGPSSQPDDDISDKEIHEFSSTSDSERTESDTEAAAPKGDKDQDEVDRFTCNNRVRSPVLAPEKAHEALA
ncbi:hypothetical protein Tco_0057897 [Tanacetum coccineum]